MPKKNPHIFGVGIPATVKERSGNCVRVHFDIDSEYDASPNTLCVIAKNGGDGGESGISSIIENIQSKSPQQLIADGWKDVTNPKMAANTTSREFYDSKSGLKIRFDKGVDGANGFEAVDHYHVMNPNYTNKKVDYYYDKDGKPVGKGSKASHIVIKGEK